VRLRLVAVLLVAGTLATLAWYSELFTVEKSGAVPRPLELLPADSRGTARFDAMLAVVPVGVQHLRPGGSVMLVHYWAPWERHSGVQAKTLDSLRSALPPGAVQVAVVCFDPFPSVARYVGRMRLRVPVMLDPRRSLARTLPCPSIPYTYVIDRAGRIAVVQGGEIDWLSPATRATLDRVIDEAPPPRPDSGTAL